MERDAERTFRLDEVTRSGVMPGLVPGIRVFTAWQRSNDVDGRDKPGHGGVIASQRLRVGFVFLADCEDVRAHRARGAGLVAAQDREHDPVMLDMRLGEASDQAELRAGTAAHACASPSSCLPNTRCARRRRSLRETVR